MKSIDEMIEDINATAPSAATPPELHARLLAFARAHPGRLTDARVVALLLAASFIEEGLEVTDDREVLERHVVGELLIAAAFVAESMKRRIGEPSSPARFAIVAYTLAEAVRCLPFVDPAAEAAGRTTTGIPIP